MNKILGETGRQTGAVPAAHGFYMPGEYMAHAACWMAWPCRDALWNGKIEAARDAYAAVAGAIARFEPVVMLANPQSVPDAKARIGAPVEVIAQPLDDSWMRDIGPTFLVTEEGRVAGADWRFNAWGSKWPDYAADSAVAQAVLARLGARRFAADFVLEGGSIHSDGEGTVLASEQCLLNPNRNPGLTRDEIEANLKAWLGGHTVIWLGRGLDNDDTDGHVDNLACFVRPGVVLVSVAEDRNDTNYPALNDNLRRLKAARDARGRALTLIELPIPSPKFGGSGRLACNYVNSYLANGAVIAPAFDDPADAIAKTLLCKAFPDREIVQIPALAILEGGGGIHCITQQQPAGMIAPPC